ncbi:hypothetical protein CASFOL_001254 [Castilleja foliolosa]|uniref:Uncharacterized protein n=1 Tax=Castilleja foliolosa TaxID=1961234 RepID=A0ABD3EM22_9LAMI
MPNNSTGPITIPDSSLFSIQRRQEKLAAPAITDGVLRAAWFRQCGGGDNLGRFRAPLLEIGG